MNKILIRHFIHNIHWDLFASPIYIYIYRSHIYQPLRSGRIWHKVKFFKRSLTGLNSEFSFSWTSCLSKAEEPCLSYYLPKAGGRIIWFIPFPRVLVLCEMQSVSSRIWTRVAVSNSCVDNHYTLSTHTHTHTQTHTHTHIYIFIHRQICFVLSELISVARQ